MFSELVEGLVGLPDAELDEAIRDSELAARAHAARHAALIAVAATRGSYRNQGHRTLQAYLRATVNTSGGSIWRDRKLARLVDAHPVVGEALLAGRISADHALEIAVVHANPRISHVLSHVVGVFVEQAEHRSYSEFRSDIQQFVNAVDQDGAFRAIADNVEQRTARVSNIDGCLDVVASGGDPITAEQVRAVFASFVEGEYQRDLEARRAQFGDEADQHPLPRTAAQRRFDAIVAIFAAAAASPEGRALPEPTVLIGCDAHSFSDALTRAGVVLPNGNQVDLDELAEHDATMVTMLADELLEDPEAFRHRRCETMSGAAIPAMIALQAAMLGHVRRVLVDSQGVVVDLGVKQRLFAGNTRLAAQWMMRTCTFPGCNLPASVCQVDHNEEWNAGGRTDQANANIECGPHNLYKHRNRLRTRRDSRGRVYHLKPDGTIMLPVGERPPDLSIDELTRAARARLAALSRPDIGRPQSWVNPR